MKANSYEVKNIIKLCFSINYFTKQNLNGKIFKANRESWHYLRNEISQIEYEKSGQNT